MARLRSLSLYNVFLFLLYGIVLAGFLFLLSKFLNNPPFLALLLFQAALMGALGFLHEVWLRDTPNLKKLKKAQGALDRSEEELLSLKQEIRRLYTEMREQKPLNEVMSSLEFFRPGSAEMRMVDTLAEQIASLNPETALQAHHTTVLDNTHHLNMLDTMRSAVKADRVDLYLQPIVSLPQRKQQYFECFSRIRDEDGNVLEPDEYIEAAKEAGLITAIDNMLFFRCIQLIRKIQKRQPNLGFFCNLSHESLQDPHFFEDFVLFLEENPDLAHNLIFEITQRDFEVLDLNDQPYLRRLAILGCRFSMDQVLHLNFEPESLLDYRVKFIKIRADFLLFMMAQKHNALDLREFKANLDRLAIDLIIERVENEDALLNLLDYQIDFGQGYLFGEPKISKM